MTEIYANISKEVRETAEMAWKLAIAQPNPMKAASFLNMIIEYYKNIYTEDEVNFIQFYFNMKMEMGMKEDE